MRELKLPFWMIAQRQHILVETEHSTCGRPDVPHAFTSTRKLTEFLSARRGGSWRVELVADRESLLLAVAQMHSSGKLELCINPNSDGSGGELVGMVQLITSCDSSLADSEKIEP